MLENTQLYNVVILSTEKAIFPNCLWLGRISGQLHLDKSYPEGKTMLPIDDSMLPQHLYIISNEEIKSHKINDWVYEPTNTIPIYQFSYDIDNYPLRRVIATTNPELWDIKQIDNWNYGVPKIPTTFLQPYVDAYNSGKPVTQVLLETQEIHRNTDDIIGMDGIPNGLLMYEEVLKLRNDSSVIIHPIVEKKYTREEVKEICESSLRNVRAFNSHVQDMCGDKEHANYHFLNEFNNWFDKKHPE